ncbi:AEC family transporter [Roseibium aggregatum]|uniref:Malonate transporter n=1 Tax=Roseibium aggregatum TaxID=187304 RepID=A0A926S5Z3_9HYPH|nr:AEC family transporter [Roseibium aggregatum]MBD1548003.1 malonate transporter [Roseibium aggregatum]
MSLILAALQTAILPVFAALALGLGLGWRGVLTRADATSINKFVILAALPALLFGLVARAPLAQFDLKIVLIYLLSEVLMYGLGFVVAWRFFKRPVLEALLIGMACCFANHVFFVFPIAQVAIGPNAALPVAAVMAVDAVVLYGTTILLLDVVSAGSGSLVRIAKQIGSNPLILSLAAGVLVNFSGLQLHEGLIRYVDFVGAATAPSALFALGVMLSAVSLKRIEGAVAMAALFKILVHPLVYSAIVLLAGGSDPVWQNSVLLVAAGPCGAMPFVLALRYGIDPTVIMKAILLSTVTSVFTLAFLL